MLLLKGQEPTDNFPLIIKIIKKMEIKLTKIFFERVKKDSKAYINEQVLLLNT